MIIKRRVTRGFVQIANEVVRDRRLALDEHGLLHYLLSLPDDWEVNLRQIETYWKIGRDKRRRLFRALRKTGWAQLERITSEDGAFLGQRWIIGDDPGPEVTDETLASEDDAEDAAEGTPTKTTAAPESKGPDALVLASRETPFQAVGSADGRETRPPENTVLPRRKTPDEDLQTTNTTGASSISNESEDDDGEPPPPFGSLLRLWPSEHMVSAFACEKSYSRFTDKQKVQAFHGVKPYLDDCRSKGHNRLCDLRTYLDERRFEKFASKAVAGKQLCVVKRGTPQAERWREHLRKTAPQKLGIFEMQMQSRGEYTTETEWPPAIDPLARSA